MRSDHAQSSPTAAVRTTRRTLLAGAAWSAPVIAVALATPTAAASVGPGPVPNDEAGYFWDTAAGTDFATLDPATSGNRAQFSTQISYRSEPWVNPPSAGILVISVTFNAPVTIANLNAGWALDGDTSTPATTFIFRLSPSAFGDGLSFDADAAASGELRALATMSIVNPDRPDGSSTTWAEEPATASAMLVA